MKQQNEFNSEHEHEHKAEQQQAHEFSTTEDLLRFDNKQVDVPAAIAERLQKSSADLPRPGRSWWQRFFGGNR